MNKVKIAEDLLYVFIKIFKYLQLLRIKYLWCSFIKVENLLILFYFK